MTEREFERTCALLARTYGLDMRAKRILLECRLSRERERLGAPSFGAYLDLVESGEPDVEARFADLATTHYTYFLRESNQFDFITRTALPDLQRRKPDRPWNILCAGCSTGEECYSLSMLIEDYAALHPLPNVRITGMDVSEHVLKTARRGRYAHGRIDKVPARWKALYFEADGDEHRVTDQVRRHVRFERCNLSATVALPRTYDLILCRNVIIYFGSEVRRRVIDLLGNHLVDEGYLVLGHAETVHDRSKFAYCGNSIYRKQTETQTL